MDPSAIGYCQGSCTKNGSIPCNLCAICEIPYYDMLPRLITSLPSGEKKRSNAINLPPLEFK